MADVLSEKARALITRPLLASLATLNPDGSPQITPLWIDLDGDDVVFNTAQGRKKARNLERDARVAVTVIDPDDQYNVVAFQGTVSDVTTEGADAHIDAGIFEIQRMGMALRSIADDGYFLALDQREIGILVVVSLGHSLFLLVQSNYGS